MSGQATLFAAQTALVENPPPPEPANTDHAPATGGTDLVCFSHLRWDFVYQRPQHLLTPLRPRPPGLLRRGAGLRRRGRAPARAIQRATGRCHGRGAAPAARARCRGGGRGAQRALLDGLLARARHRATRCSGTTRRWRSPSRDHLEAAAGRLRLHGRAVGLPRRAAGAARARAPSCSRRADLVFTGGQSLYEAKRAPAPRTSTPSRAASTSRTSRRRASRLARAAPTRRRSRTRGSASSACIDERMDLDLLAAVADAAARLAVRA